MFVWVEGEGDRNAGENFGSHLVGFFFVVLALFFFFFRLRVDESVFYNSTRSGSGVHSEGLLLG